MAVNGHHLYWISGNTGTTIWEAGLDGSNPTPLISVSAGGYPAWLAADNSHVYWTTNSQYMEPPYFRGTVWEGGLDGSNPTPIVVNGQDDLQGVAVGP